MKKRYLKKFGIGIIATILVCITCFTGCGKIKQKVNDIVDSISGSAENGGAVVNESENNGIAVTSTKLSASEYAENGISEQADSAYKLTATFSPSVEDFNLVDWSVSWVNAESQFATGKTVTDYVTVTPTSDGALTANVVCKQAFGEQIKITVICRSDKSKFADCLVDYREKIVGMMLGSGRKKTGSVDYDYSNPLYASCVDITDNRIVVNKSFENLYNIDTFDKNLPVYVLSPYTISDTFSESVVFVVNRDYINYLSSGGITVKDWKEINMNYEQLLCGTYFFSGHYRSGSVPFDSPLGIPSDQVNEAIKIARQHTDIPVFSFMFSKSSAYSQYYKTYNFYFSESSLEYVVDNVTLNESNIVF